MAWIFFLGTSKIKSIRGQGPSTGGSRGWVMNIKKSLFWAHPFHILRRGLCGWDTLPLAHA